MIVPQAAINQATAAVMAQRGLHSEESRRWVLPIVTTALKASAPFIAAIGPELQPGEGRTGRLEVCDRIDELITALEGLRDDLMGKEGP